MCKLTDVMVMNAFLKEGCPCQACIYRRLDRFYQIREVATALFGWLP